MVSKIMFLLFMAITVQSLENFEEILKNRENATEGRLLSRKRRYLIFPEGSSLQLVYCLTMPIIGMSSIFTIGGTASLAWQLPHDPFIPGRKPAELLHRKDNPPKGGWTYSDVNNKKYNKKVYLNNAPAKMNSAWNLQSLHWNQRPNSWNQQMLTWNTQNSNWNLPKKSRNKNTYSTIRNNPEDFRESSKRKYFHYHPVYHKIDGATINHADILRRVHKRTRRDLYSKIERFFKAQKLPGRDCMLKSICEVSQMSSSTTGTFMEEIFKVIFKPKPDDNVDEDHYDTAYDVRHDCEYQYPNCNSSVWNVLG